MIRNALFSLLCLLVALSFVAETVAQPETRMAKPCGYYDLGTTACPGGCSALFQGSKAVEGIFCSVVPPGFYSEENRTSFLPCEDGHYNPVFRASSCLPCPIGTFTNDFASTYCQPCPAGAYQDQTGQTSCKSCDTFSYAGKGANHKIEDEWGKTYCALLTNRPSSSPSSIPSSAPSMLPSVSPSMLPSQLPTLPATPTSSPKGPKTGRGWTRGASILVASVGIAALFSSTVLFCAKRPQEKEDFEANLPEAKSNSKEKSRVNFDSRHRVKEIMVDAEHASHSSFGTQDFDDPEDPVAMQLSMDGYHLDDSPPTGPRFQNPLPRGAPLPPGDRPEQAPSQPRRIMGGELLSPPAGHDDLVPQPPPVVTPWEPEYHGESKVEESVDESYYRNIDFSNLSGIASMEEPTEEEKSTTTKHDHDEEQEHDKNGNEEPGFYDDGLEEVDIEDVAHADDSMMAMMSPSSAACRVAEEVGTYDDEEEGFSGSYGRYAFSPISGTVST